MELAYPQQANGMYYLSKYAIEDIATQELKEHCPAMLNYPCAMNTERFLDDHGLIIKRLYLGIPGHEILGAIVMVDEADVLVSDTRLRPDVISVDFGTVLIHSGLCSKKYEMRRRYTEMHEVSHWLLHQPYFARSDSSYIACRSVERYKMPRKTEHDWLEWQADTLAAALLMPRDVFYDYARTAIRNAGARQGYLCEGNAADRKIYHQVIQDISSRFRVSKKAAQIRMIHLGLIKTKAA